MNTKTMARCAIFAALLCISAWLCIPFGDITFTMQTFSLFLTLLLLGGKQGSLVCLIYLLLGIVGLPVFSGFRGGLGMLLGTTGGYIAGFLAAALTYWIITAMFGFRFPVKLLACIAGLLVCYLFGTFWFSANYLQGGEGLGFTAIIAKCVLPYLLPDGIKLALALLAAAKLKRFLPA